MQYIKIRAMIGKIGPVLVDILNNYVLSRLDGNTGPILAESSNTSLFYLDQYWNSN